MQVSEILKVKGNILYTVSPTMSLLEAINLMAEKDIGSLVVMENGSLAGLLTFREVMRAVHANQGSVGNSTVGEHMEREVLTMSPDTDVNDIRRLMLERHSRYVPVMEGRVLLGVMSFYDVAKSVFEAQNFENTLLKAYIRDWPVEDKTEDVR
jgi:CBS domain-containing protein